MVCCYRQMYTALFTHLQQLKRIKCHENTSNDHAGGVRSLGDITTGWSFQFKFLLHKTLNTVKCTKTTVQVLGNKPCTIPYNSSFLMGHLMLFAVFPVSLAWISSEQKRWVYNAGAEILLRSIQLKSLWKINACIVVWIEGNPLRMKSWAGMPNALK